MKRIKLLILLLALMTGVTSAWAENPSGTCGDNLTWEYNPSNTTLTISGSGDMYDYAWNTIPWNSYKSSITSVSLPEGLTSIREYAFGGCSGLTSITIPSSVTGIGDYAFQECTNLETVTFATGSQLTRIQRSTFNFCSSLTSVDIPDGVVEIQAKAFSSCTALTSVTIPSSVTLIRGGAFEYCTGLTDVTMKRTGPTTLEGDSYIFLNVDLSNVKLHIPAGSEVYYSSTLWNSFGTKVVYGTCGANLTWEYNPSTTTLTISGTGDMYNYNNTTSYAPWYENYKDDITTVVLPNGMTSIGDYAFFMCSKVTSFDIPSSATTIGGHVFHACTKLTDVTVHWTDLSDVHPASGAFLSNISMSNVNLHVPEGTYALYAAADGWKNFKIVDPIGGKCGDNLFWSYNSSTTTLTITGEGQMYSYVEDKVPWKEHKPYITSIVLPEGLTYTGGRSFLGCTSLTSVTIPSSVTSIGAWSFLGCTNLETVTIAAGSQLTGIGSYAFQNCTSLTSISLPSTVTGISGSAFYGCTGLTSFTIPSSVTTINSLVFYNCTSLTSVNIPAGVTSISNQAFRECTGLQSVSLPETLTSIGAAAFLGCTSLQSITIPNGVTSIQMQTFYNCTGLTSIDIPSSVTSIGNGAFQGTALTDVTVPWTDLTSVNTDANAFSGLTLANINLYVPAGTYATYAAVAPWNSFNIIDPYGGKCGDNLIWIYDPTSHALTITGSGDMYDWYDTPDVPWYGDREDIKSISMDNDITHIGSYAFYECDNAALKTISLPNKLTSIGFNAFRGCTSLTSITIPNSVTTIGGSAFQYCSSLASITIPSGVTVIGNYAFDECSSLASANIPDGVTLIDAGIFNGCSSLGAITIPSGVTEIKQYAFHNTALTTIDIPSGVTSIGYYAFGGCSGLTDIYVPWTDLTSVTTDADAFDGVTTSAVNLHLPFAAWSNYETANIWKDFKQVPVVTAKADPENDGVYYNTFYHGTVAYALPTGVEAYTAQRDGTDLILTKIAQAGDVLPAGTAVILKSSVQQFEMTPSDASPVTVGENDLLGKDASETAPSNCYVLSGPNPSNPDITEVGFYQFTGTLGAHKAYLVLPGSSGAPKRLRFVFDSTQDIEEPTSDSSLKGGEKILLDGILYIQRGEHMYNAQGQMVR